MYNKLLNHRISKANIEPYDTSLDENFTPQEHEFICDELLKYQQKINESRRINESVADFTRYIKGNYPDRKYVGKVAAMLLNAFDERNE